MAHTPHLQPPGAMGGGVNDETPSTTAATPHTRAPRPSVGGYVLGSRLGRGAFSSIYKTHDMDGSPAAIKVIKQTGGQWDKVRREIRVMQDIGAHPAVLSLLDVVDDGQHLALVLPRANGDLCEAIMRDGVFDETNASRVLRQVGHGLRFIHMRGWAHRDLKPDNILTLEGGRVVIADFGLANSLQHGQLLRTPCGTRAYAAPEVILHHEYQGQAADVWSLGVLLHVMVKGEFPWEYASHESQLFRAYSRGETLGLCPPWFSHECTSLIRSMLTINVQDRATMDDVLAHPWMNDDMKEGTDEVTEHDGQGEQHDACDDTQEDEEQQCVKQHDEQQCVKRESSSMMSMTSDEVESVLPPYETTLAPPSIHGDSEDGDLHAPLLDVGKQSAAAVSDGLSKPIMSVIFLALFACGCVAVTLAAEVFSWHLDHIKMPLPTKWLSEHVDVELDVPLLAGTVALAGLVPAALALCQLFTMQQRNMKEMAHRLWVPKFANGQPDPMAQVL